MTKRLVSLSALLLAAALVVASARGGVARVALGILVIIAAVFYAREATRRKSRSAEFSLRRFITGVPSIESSSAELWLYSLMFVAAGLTLCYFGNL